MVSLAHLFLAVSTLATLSNALPKELPVVRHLCGNATFCDVKPPDYPQEEIDRIALKFLPQLRRLKRNLRELKPETPKEGGNCAYEYKKVKPAFTIRDKNNVPHYLIHSKWFDQSFDQIICKEKESMSPANGKKEKCFSKLLIDETLQTECVTKIVESSVLVYNTATGEPSSAKVFVAVDCVCVVS